MNNIRAYFNQLVNINDTDWEIFSSKLLKNELGKKDFILEAGQIEHNLSFIESGSVRLYIPKEDKDVTFGFCFENQFVSAYDSFLTRMPCSYSIQTLTNVILWQISYEDLQKVYAKSQIGNTIGRLAAESLFLIKSQREQSLLNETAEERYLSLFQQRPKLIKEIPLKYLASYIGVTPQALSRIRKRITR